MHTSGVDLKITANGISICYDDLGAGAIPILFIHGFPFDKSSWQPQMDAMKGKNRVIAYDIRGFGQSGADESEASMDVFADDLILFMDALQIKSVIACGLSMGGYILLNAMQRFPDRFKGIVLADTQCISDSPETMEKRFKTCKKIIEEGVIEFAEKLVSTLFCKATQLSNRKVVEEIKNTILATSPITITNTLKALANRKDMCASLNKIRVPAFIICGWEDVVTPLLQADVLFDNIPGAKRFTISNAGHLANLEQPEKFNAQLTNFLMGIGHASFLP
jgi:3-oxoadipate enol-lactonase